MNAVQQQPNPKSYRKPRPVPLGEIRLTSDAQQLAESCINAALLAHQKGCWGYVDDGRFAVNDEFLERRGCVISFWRAQAGDMFVVQTNLLTQLTLVALHEELFD